MKYYAAVIRPQSLPSAVFLRWPTTITSNTRLLTSKTNCSHQIKITHIKYKILTSNTNYSHQIQITHIKYKILTSNTNYSHQIQIAHIKYKILTSKTRLNGQRSENENYVQFSLGLDPTAILFLHVVLSSGCFAAPAEEMSTIATFVATAGKVS